MKGLKVFLWVVSLVAFGFGLAMIFFPQWTVALYGSELDVTGQFMGRYFGSALLGLGVIFLVGNYTSTVAGLQKAGLLGGLVFGVSGLAVSIWDSIAGTHTRLMWLNLVIYSIFTVGFAVYYALSFSSKKKK